MKKSRQKRLRQYFNARNFTQAVMTLLKQRFTIDSGIT